MKFKNGSTLERGRDGRFVRTKPKKRNNKQRELSFTEKRMTDRNIPFSLRADKAAFEIISPVVGYRHYLCDGILYAEKIPEKEKQKSAIDEAKEIIYGDREQTYGTPDKNFNTIANFWTNYLRARGLLKDGSELLNTDTAIMQTLLKVARHANTYKRDNIVDGIGYLACADRIEEELKQS